MVKCPDAQSAAVKNARLPKNWAARETKENAKTTPRTALNRKVNRTFRTTRHARRGSIAKTSGASRARRICITKAESRAHNTTTSSDAEKELKQNDRSLASTESERPAEPRNVKKNV